jgi:hypothetical protein
LLVLLCGACGRIGFDGRVGGVDAGNGSKIADAPCTFGPFSTPTRLDPGVQAVDDDWFPSPAVDETLLMFHTYRPTSQGADLWIALRASASLPFATPTRIIELSTTDDEMTPVVSEDGLEIFFATRTALPTELYRAQRGSLADPWGTPELLSTLGSPSADYMPWITADGTELWFSSARPGTIGFLDLWVATRAARGAPFAAPSHVTALGSTNDDGCPTLSADALEIFFTSDRPGGPGQLDVFTSRRPARDQPFDAPRVVMELSSTGDEFGLRLSADGTTMYLNYNTDVNGGGDADMWRATRNCL